MDLSSSPIPAVGIGAIVFDDVDNILLIKRGKEPAKNQWSVPGGKLEPGETLVQACQREVLEETGLMIQVGPVIAIAERITAGFHYVIVDFSATLTQPSPQPKAASDVSDAKWIPAADLKNYNLVEGLLPIIERTRTLFQGERRCGLYDIEGNGRDFLAINFCKIPKNC